MAVIFGKVAAVQCKVQYFFFFLPSKCEGSTFCFLRSFEECQNISGHFVHLWTKYQSPQSL